MVRLLISIASREEGADHVLNAVVHVYRWSPRIQSELHRIARVYVYRGTTAS